MLKQIDWDKVEKLVAERYIDVKKHPDLDLWIYNYSRHCQYDANWTNETLQCRGLIVDRDKNVVGQCIPKFWSYDQLLSFRSHTWASHILRKIDTEPFTVQDKADGSCGFICNYKGNLVTATRGSFNSDQAIKLREILDNKYPDFTLAEGYTLIGEIIFKSNRIVCDYGDTEDFFLFAAIDNASNQELDIYQLDVPFPKVERYEYSSFEELCALQPEGKEGFVVRFADGSRVKIKTDDYKLKHKIITNTNERTIWEYLSEGKPLDDLIAITDDVFDDFIKTTVHDLDSKFHFIGATAVSTYNDILDSTDKDLSLAVNRKIFAQAACKTKYPALLFCLLDQNMEGFDKLIWRLIEPKFPKKAFSFMDDDS